MRVRYGNHIKKEHLVGRVLCPDLFSSLYTVKDVTYENNTTVVELDPLPRGEQLCVVTDRDGKTWRVAT
jgi:hypothetical protein